MPQLKAKPDWLKTMFSSRAVGVDAEAKVIRGYVVAQEGYLKDGRGQFVADSLQKIITLMNAKQSGLKSRFGHPTLSSDGLATYLGRSKNAFLDTVTVNGKTLQAVRADLHLDPSSFDTPKGNLGQYVLDLAQSDSDALSSSLVLQTEQVQVLDDKGRPKMDPETGDPIPPIWLPTVLHASDIVDEGAAVDGLLSFDVNTDGELPDAIVRQASALLTSAFPGQPREVVKARCEAWLEQYLTFRYGEQKKPNLSKNKAKIAEREKSCPGNLTTKE